MFSLRYRTVVLGCLTTLTTTTVVLIALSGLDSSDRYSTLNEPSDKTKSRQFHNEDSSRLNVYVFEEHHEALDFWFKAADSGQIPRQGNTLIHIDGHSDEETPDYEKGMPFFRYPRNKREVTYLAQKNDVFIQAAVMSGLVSRVIWIRPTWDRDAYESEGPYKSQLIGLGWFPAHVSDGNVQPFFCRCEFGPGDDDIVNTSLNRSSDVTSGNIRRCTHLIESDSSDDGDFEKEIDPHKCQVMAYYRSEHVVENRALEILGTLSSSGTSWLSGSSSRAHSNGVILDIDEDFFGCEVPSDRIVETVLGNDDRGITWSEVVELDELVSAFLCPRDADQEDVADRLLRELLSSVTTACFDREKDIGKRTTDISGSTDDEDSITGMTSSCQKSFVGAMPLMTNALTWSPSIFCAGGGNTEAVLRSWLAFALHVVRRLPLSLIQHHIINNVGFCLNSAPRTLHFRRRSDIGQLTVCHGANGPNSTLVYHDTPSNQAELDARIDNFDRLLSAIATELNAPPATIGVHGKPTTRRRVGLVTVCRSVRDGYTPRAMALRIEAGVLRSVKQHFGDKQQRKVTVVYDKDLLGGERGWDARVRYNH